MKTSIPLTVYRVEPSTLADVAGGRIRQYAFRSTDQTPDELGSSSVPDTDMFADLNISIPEKSNYMNLDFRIDTRKVPSIVFKKHLAEMTQEELQRTGKAFLSRDRKRELKKLRKTRLLSKTEPHPSMPGAVIDKTTGLVYFANTSKSVLELFEKYFETVSNDELERLSPSTLTASDSDHPLEDFMRDLYTESMAPSLNRKEYHITEQGKTTLSQADGATVSVTDVPSSALTDFEPGLLFKSLKIKLSTMPDDEPVPVFTLNADFSFSGLKAPHIKIEKGNDDPGASFMLKIGFTEKAVAAVHSLFRQHAGN